MIDRPAGGMQDANIPRSNRRQDEKKFNPSIECSSSPEKKTTLLKNLDAKSHPASLKSMDWIPIKLLERFKILFISNARRCVLLASRIVRSRPPSHTYAALAPLPADDADVRSDVAALGTSADRTDTVLGKDK
jgi:hypothetical protein